MKNNTGRNIFLIVLGYYLLTGNYKAARNFVIAYVVMFLIFGCVLAGIAINNSIESKKQEAWQLELEAKRKERELQEAKQFASDVLPAFVKQFKGKMMKGDFNDLGGLDSYGFRFKILNDSMLTYQISESEDYSPYMSPSRQKWSTGKKVKYSLVPAVRDNGTVMTDRLSFQFESYKGEIDVIKSKKKKKYQISTPLHLTDSDNLSAYFWGW